MSEAPEGKGTKRKEPEPDDVFDEDQEEGKTSEKKAKVSATDKKVTFQGGDKDEVGDGEGEEEEEEEEEEGHVGTGAVEDFESSGNKEQQAAYMKAVLDRMTPEQMERYEKYRRSVLQKPLVKKLIHSIAGIQASKEMILIVCGISKIFVGDLVEHGKLIMQEWNDTGPLTPEHIREAYRRISEQGHLPGTSRAPSALKPI